MKWVHDGPNEFHLKLKKLFLNTVNFLKNYNITCWMKIEKYIELWSFF